MMTIKNELYRWYRMKFHKQTCFVYCPKCKNELVSSNSFIEDKDGIVKYECDKCGNISFLDFIHYPIPYLRTCANNCVNCKIDDFGQPYCNEDCSPDTMVKFQQRYYSVGWED